MSFKVSRLPVYFMKVPSQIRQKGLGRLLNEVLSMLGIKKSLRLSIIRFVKILSAPVLYIKSKNISIYTSALNNIRVPKNKHELAIPEGELDGVPELLTHLRSYFESNREAIEKAFVAPYSLLIKPAGKDQEEVSDEQIALIKPILKFASQPKLMGLAADYLGQIPTLSNTSFIYTPAMEKGHTPINAQMFHRDALDPDFLHLVIPVYDIGPKNGPFTYINAKKSLEIITALNHEDGRVKDEIIEKFISPENYTKLTGKAGSAWFVNPYHCFHHGARVEEGFRVMLIISFATPHERVEGLAALYRPKYKNKLIGPDTTKAERHLLKAY